MVNLSVNINGLSFKNPIITASGTFGYGIEFNKFFDIQLLGGIVFKTLTIKPKEGNPYPRIVETEGGILNSIGLQNIGINNFINEIYPLIKDLNLIKIVSIAGNSPEEYYELADIIEDLEKIDALELNVSCPNVKEGGVHFGYNIKLLGKLVSEIKKRTKKILIVKLPPDITNIVNLAKEAENCGADILSLINTIKGMAVDTENFKPKLSTITGGLSGPCIKPIALYLVWEVVKNVNIPIIGIGGIMNYKDVLEYLSIGAKAVQIGTANLLNPLVTINIINDLKNYLIKKNFSDINQIIGIFNKNL